MGSGALIINALVDWSAEDGPSCEGLSFGALVIATEAGGTAGSWSGLGSNGDATEGVRNVGKCSSVPAAAVDDGTLGGSNAFTALFGRAIAFACELRTQHGAAVAVD
jgi:hypothetical protein